MTKPTRNFNSVKKDRLFFDRFEYSLGFYLEEVSSMRVLDHAYIDETIQRRLHWRETARKRWVNLPPKQKMVLTRDWKDITEQTVANLHALADLLLTAPEEFKLVVTVNHAYVYTSDLSLIDRLDDLPQLLLKSYSRAVISRPKNTIELKDPKHRFRSYFRAVNLSAQHRDQLAAFLETQQSQIRLSPALTEWAALPFTRVQDYFFVDHDTESWLTMLNLVAPGITRKTMHIIAAK